MALGRRESRGALRRGARPGRRRAAARRREHRPVPRPSRTEPPPDAAAVGGRRRRRRRRPPRRAAARPRPSAAPRPRAAAARGAAASSPSSRSLAIGFALYLINATFQPFHGDGSGRAACGPIPESTDAGTIGDLLAAKGVVASGGFFELNATLTGRRGKLRPGDYTLRQDMSNGDAIAALEKGPKVKVVPTVERHGARGPVDPRGGAGGRQGAAEGQLPRRRRASAACCAAIRRLGAPRGTKHRRGLHVPGHLHAGRRQPGARPRRPSSSPRSRTTSQASTCATPSARTSRATTC